MAGTSAANYLIEVDGIAVCEAQEIESGEVKHEPFKIHTGTRPNPILGRGSFEVGEIKVKQCYALNNEGAAFAQAFQDYIRGLNLTKLNIRIVTLDEDGRTPIASDDYIECVPTLFQPDAKKGDSKDAAGFTIGFMPSDHLPSY